MFAGGEDGVLPSGAADGGIVAVPGVDDGVIRQREEPLHNRLYLLLQVLRTVAVAGAAREEGVAGDEEPASKQT